MEGIRKQRIATQYPTRIGLVGKQRTGKSTVAEYLKKQYEFFEKPLAEPIYGLASSYFGMEEKDRQLLIDIGESMREIDRDVWLKYMWRKCNNMDRVVVPDVRMKHEYNYMKARGFIFIKIKTNYHIRSNREGYNKEAEDSRTEQEVNEIPADYTIFNVSTLAHLYNQVDHIMESLS